MKREPPMNLGRGGLARPHVAGSTSGGPQGKIAAWHFRNGATAVHSLFIMRRELTGARMRLALLDFTKHRLDINDRRAVNRFDRTDLQATLFDFAHRYLMKTDRIGPVWRPRREHSGKSSLRV